MVHPAAAHAIGLVNRVTNAMRKMVPEAVEETPATPPPLPLSALPPARAPIWNGPPGRPATPLDITPIPGKLPSGRVPGAPAIDPATGNIVQNAGGGQFQAPTRPRPHPSLRPRPHPSLRPRPRPQPPPPPRQLHRRRPRRKSPSSPRPRRQAPLLFEAKARAVKVAKLADTLEGQIPAEDIAKIEPEMWERLAKGLNIEKPSAETIARVAEELKAREAQAAAPEPTMIAPSAEMQAALQKARRARSRKQALAEEMNPGKKAFKTARAKRPLTKACARCV